MTIPKDNTQLENARRLRRDMTPHERKLWFLFLRKYPVKISNSLPGGKEWYDAGVWEIAKKRNFWKEKIFNVADYGATCNDNTSDSRAFERAVEDVKKNNGGIIYIPAGRYILKNTLTLPPHTLLKGEDRSLSQICWPDTMNPVTNLIEGTHSFAIHDLFISSGSVSSKPD